MTLTRLESFPFDSRYDGFDDEGYPVYDRAVGAKTMRDVFAHFFSDGVFSDTTYPFRLTKAASGLAVTVNPGVIIINGGWGILPESTTLTLATGTTAGVIKYAVFARYDNNDEHRTLYLRTDASSAGGAVPEPSTTEANVTEYRIGYVTVPSNSTNLTNATITNEVGTSKCPYAVPLFDIDPAEVLEDLRQDAQAAYDKYYTLLQSALDDTTAGHLQNQIDAMSETVSYLNENAATKDQVDPQAMRAAMGFGNTLGVLEVEYGGTGVDGVLDLAKLLKIGAIYQHLNESGERTLSAGSFPRENGTTANTTEHFYAYIPISDPGDGLWSVGSRSVTIPEDGMYTVSYDVKITLLSLFAYRSDPSQGESFSLITADGTASIGSFNSSNAVGASLSHAKAVAAKEYKAGATIKLPAVRMTTTYASDIYPATSGSVRVEGTMKVKRI